MKVLVINTVPTEKNGITNVIFNYLSAMEAGEATFDFVSLNDPDKYYSEVVRRNQGEVFVIRRSPSNIYEYIIKLIEVIKRNTYDIVHIHGNSHTLVLELLAAKFAGCQIRIVHAHTTQCNSLLLHKVLSPFFDILCTHRLACGEDAGRFMFGTKSFKVMNNGVDTEKYAFNLEKRNKIREQIGWTDNIVIGHIGYFMPLKNQSFIVDVFERLYQQNPNNRLLLIGDGPLRGEVERKLEEKGLRNVSCLTGNIDNVDDYLNAIDVIVMPSLYEGLPLTLIEQQVNGLVCVVSNNITHEVDKTGNLKFLSLDSSIADWAEAVMEEDGQSREDRSRKAVVSITAAGYNIKEQAKKLEDFYNEALTNR